MRTPAIARTETVQLLIGATVIVLTGIVPDLLGQEYWSHSFRLVNILIAAAVFQNLLMHDANQISFGQGAIFGVGAYVAAMSMQFLGLPWIAAAAIAACAAGLTGLLFAIPALRVQGYYLGFVTLSAAMVFPELLYALDKYTNGINGIASPPGAWTKPVLLGVTPLSLASAGIACLAMLFHVALRHSAYGRKIRVAGASPEAAQTLGIRPGLVRAAVFILTAVGTGIAGALYAPIVGFVTPAAFHLEFSILLFLAVIVGGKGQMLGPVAGIFLLYLLPNVLLVNLIDYRLLAYGLLALVVMLAFPDGLIGTFERRLRAQRAIAGAELRPSEFPVADHTQDSETPGDRGAEVSVRGATKSFGAVRALDHVDLDIARGTIVGIVGGNGSGKTTLLNTITGFNRLSDGTVKIRDTDVSGLSPARIAHLGAGRTFQTPRIFDTLTAFENVLIGAECPLVRHPAAPSPTLARMREVLAEAGTATIPHGQRRSMELLRVLLTGADLLLLDEPAAGLSTDERHELSALLVRLRDSGGKTIVLVEHDLALVWRIADVIAVMESGQIIAQGPPDELMRDPRVSKLFVASAHA
jgi:branched-chain amino acid transport system permease protein